jgi:deoxyribose-phosphate aldolase
MCKFTAEFVASKVDLACLRPYATSGDVSICCQKALRYNCASVCVEPYYVPIARRLLEGYDTKLSTVIDFPYGNNSPDVKELAIYNLIGERVDEFDMVLNIAALKDGDWHTVNEELAKAAALCHNHGRLLKVILETWYLKDTEILAACDCAVANNVDFVKTSTGSTEGAEVRTVKLMLQAVGDKCQVKASGGIHNYGDAEKFLELGCTRLGSSRIEELLPYEATNE